MYRVHFFDGIRESGSVYAVDIDSAVITASCLKMDNWDVVILDSYILTSKPIAGYEEAYAKLTDENYPPTQIPIILNGKTKMIENAFMISYEDVVIYAGYNKDSVISMTFSRGIRNLSGCLTPGSSVRLVPNMIFDAIDTGNT